ncbi:MULTISPECIES: hypothetical protein [unclassified Caballeronia]|uniref:hypothetical protein n=1 Tax=unclassified Caballeronia TaxID=2646786 RepID=UPI002855387A|nr:MULTISPECIES: hypothetical protein [unclassified Caballeronia]MDR5751940.1 hypothetical protein [Caballeronia sp. LZ024]MDR5843919.1 hypothetical protein [Caballeronia sp. LZ031]
MTIGSDKPASNSLSFRDPTFPHATGARRTGRRWPTALGAILLAASGALHAQEISLLGGVSRGIGEHTYSWAASYEEGLGEYFAASFTWINEGHVTGHHRDGQVIQGWARLPLANRRIVLSAGIGPYRYFDTSTEQDGASYSNVHGWGIVYSLRAQYYFANRWIAQLQLNRIQVQHGPNTSAALIGVAYQLDAPSVPGPRDWAPGRSTRVTGNEVTAFLGQTIVNSNESQTSFAAALEYRRGLMKYLDWTVGYLHEGNADLVRRDGLTTQLWATRAFFDDRLTLGLGAGVYFAVKQRSNTDVTGDNDTDDRFAGIVSMSASYRLGQRWTTRVTWNRIVTRYNRDTDVIVAGVGYRF